MLSQMMPQAKAFLSSIISYEEKRQGSVAHTLIYVFNALVVVAFLALLGAWIQVF